MAGYNTTFEALAAGLRPVLVPRRNPRREQAIRASRLTALGVADTVDEGVPAEEVDWLLGRDRLLPPGALAAAGIRLDGAGRAAAAVLELARGNRAPADATRTEEQVQGDTVGSAS
jgi:predicted glycosyltransferase